MEGGTRGTNGESKHSGGVSDALQMLKNGPEDVEKAQPELSAWSPPFYDCSKHPGVAWNHAVPKDEQVQYNFARHAKWYAALHPPHASSS